MNTLIAVALAYLLGTVLGGTILARLRGIDLRRTGSGNIGATNALRAGGTGLGLAVLLVDVLKGVLAVTLLPALFGLSQAGVYLCGIAVAAGHCWPAWTHFRGGKAVATLAGVFMVLMPWAFLWMLAAFALAVIATGWVALGSLFGALAAVLCVLVTGSQPGDPALAFVLAMALLVVVKHRQNIRQMLAGTEHRFERMALLRRWLKN